MTRTLETVEQKLEKLAKLAAEVYHITPDELAVSLTFFPAEKTWGISIAEFIIENNEYITNEEYLVEYIGTSVEESFSRCFEELEKLKNSPSKEENLAVPVVKDSKLLN